ncbi:MAG: DNA primase [Gemmatimonadales bacterium]|nr:DNA primase [Gemmatimonadales bacterium]
MIPDELIEQIRDTADLVEIIGENVQLKRTGADWRGPCPFHGGTHRNFAVVPKKGLYYCYVCHAAGDVYTYLMKRFGMDYPTAVREVARRVGITIPEGRAAQPIDQHRESLFGAMTVAQEWFAARLRESADAEVARKYLESRDVPMPVAAEWGLGYAPDDRSFPTAMKQLGIDEAILLEVGLLVKRDDGTVIPRFRGRLLFPIHDLRGRVVAFGGRLLRQGEPKYLNSPETPIFHKGTSLYHLHLAKNAIRKEGRAIVVEGYFDVLRPAQAGIEPVVAPLGTALTPDQAALLKRFAPTVILLYDSDSAGLKATFRAGDECLRHGLRVKVATMPPGEDPDSLVRTGGAAALEAILADAVDLLERKIQLLERKGWFEGVERRRDALDRLLPTVRAATDPIARDLYLGLVADRVGISRAVLEQELATRPVAPPPPPAPPAGPGAPRSVDVRPARPERGRVGTRVEAQLLQLMLRDPEWLERGRTEVPPERFDVPVFREIYTALLAQPAGAPGTDVAERLSPQARAAWQRLQEQAVGLEGADPDELYVAATTRLEERELLRGLPPATDIEARKDSKQRLSAGAKARFVWEKQKAQPPTRPPGRSP